MLAACNVLQSHLSDSKAVTNKDLVRNLISCLLNDVMNVVWSAALTSVTRPLCTHSWAFT